MTRRHIYGASFLVLAAIAAYWTAAGPTPAKSNAARPRSIAAWVGTKKGKVRAEQTAQRHLFKAIGYSCVAKPISKVIQELSQHVPVKLNLASLAEIGLTGKEPITVKHAKTPAAVLGKLTAEYDLVPRIGADAIEVTIVGDEEQEWVFDVTEFVTFQGSPIQSQWCDIDSLQSLITSMIAPDTWPVGNFYFPHRIENDRVLVTVSQQSHIQLDIHQLLNVMLVACEGKQRRLDHNPPPVPKLAKQPSWPVLADPDSYQVWIYDVSNLEVAPFETKWLAGLRKRVADHNAKSESSSVISRFGLGDRNVLCVNATKQSQKLIANYLSSLATQNTKPTE